MPGEQDTAVTELTAQVTDLEAQLADMQKLLDEEAKSSPDLQKAIEVQAEALKKVEELTEALETATSDLQKKDEELKLWKSLSADEVGFIGKLKPEDVPTFIAKAKKDRKAAMDAAASDDESVEMDDSAEEEAGEGNGGNSGNGGNGGNGKKKKRLVLKSEVGEAQFALIKSMAERQKRQEEALNAEIEKREMAELSKRADDEFKHVPGSTSQRAAMLKAIAKMDEPLRKCFEAVFTQSEKLADGAFKSVGVNKGAKDVPQAVQKAAQDFNTKVAEIAKRDSISQTQAMSKARKAHPELFKAYQEVQNEGGEAAN